MKLQTPLILGALIFTGNLTLQAATTTTGDIDIYRAFAMAVLAAITSFAIAPLVGFGDTLDNISQPLPVEQKPEPRSGKSN